MKAAVEEMIESSHEALLVPSHSPERHKVAVPQKGYGIMDKTEAE